MVVGNVIGGGNPVDRIKVAMKVSLVKPTWRLLCNLLFGRVVELVFTRPLEALLHAGVFPKHRYGISHLRRKAVALDLRRLHEDCLHMVLGALVVQRELERLHGLEDHTHRLHRVAEDNLLEGLSFIARVTALVDELHLLEDGRFSRFTSACTSLVRLAVLWRYVLRLTDQEGAF